MGKEINGILGAQTILNWTHVIILNTFKMLSFNFLNLYGISSCMNKYNIINSQQICYLNELGGGGGGRGGGGVWDKFCLQNHAVHILE